MNNLITPTICERCYKTTTDIYELNDEAVCLDCYEAAQELSEYLYESALEQEVQEYANS